MKNLIKKTLAAILITASSNALPSTVEIYSSSTAEIAISGEKDNYLLIAIAGGRPNESATSGKCMISANIRSRYNEYTGTLTPLNTEEFSYSEKSSKGRSISLTRTEKYLNIDNIDTVGICGLGVELIDSYSPIQGEEYRKNFAAFFKIAHDISLNHYSNNDKEKALNTLKPYAENYPKGLLSTKKTDNRIIRFLNDYAFYLQETNQPIPAIEILNDIINLAPNRKVAHLNIADAYWEIKNHKKARLHYQKYISAMRAAQKEKLIPSRAFERATYP